MSPLRLPLYLLALLLLSGALLSRVSAEEEEAKCSIDCTTPSVFKTNEDEDLWEGPTKGNITFCADYVDYAFCPKKWNLNSTLYDVAEMDQFAEDFYDRMLAIHTGNCNANILGNTCYQCAPALKPYACYYAFQPCKDKVIGNVCYFTCTAVLSCQFQFDCVHEPLSPVAESGDPECVGSASSLSVGLLPAFFVGLQMLFAVIRK